MNACLKSLAAKPHVELLVSWIKPNHSEAPFNISQFSWNKRTHWCDDMPDFDNLDPALEQFNPDIILITSWHIPAYRQLAKKWRGRTVRVLAMDNQWNGTLKQWAGWLVAPWYVRPLYDRVFLPGQRQEKFANILGFPSSLVSMGLYSCDHAKFASSYETLKHIKAPPEAFIYIGRLSQVKGIDILASAYNSYRQQSKKPWPLIILGAGPEKHLLENIDGIVFRGFVQPDDLPDQMLDAGCLLLPSSYEPWALVVHEAVTAGQAVICSDAVGAADDLVRLGKNGYIFESNNAAQLAEMMLDYSNLSVEQRQAMSEESHRLSYQFTPDKWADIVLAMGNSTK